MKFYLGIFTLALGIGACQNSADKTTDESVITSTDTTSSSVASHDLDNGHYCFYRTEGAKNQDTTKVHLVIDKDAIYGEMDWIPAEKDQRKGTLKGSINGEQISAVWTYMQEGMTDSLKVHFKLPPTGVLTQKPMKVNADTQREETDESADYTIKYSATDCK